MAQLAEAASLKTIAVLNIASIIHLFKNRILVSQVLDGLAFVI